MATATVEEVQAHLAELIAKLKPGEELVITQVRPPRSAARAGVLSDADAAPAGQCARRFDRT